MASLWGSTHSFHGRPAAILHLPALQHRFVREGVYKLDNLRHKHAWCVVHDRCQNMQTTEERVNASSGAIPAPEVSSG